MSVARQGRYDEAFELFQGAGTAQAAHNNLGYAYFLNGETERAVEEYERALLVGGEQQLVVLRNLDQALAGVQP